MYFMSREIQIDFYSDFASACIEALVTAGFEKPKGDTGQIIMTYFNVIHRMVPRVPRIVHKASYVVAPEVVAGVKALLKAVEAGGDLRPYMSRSIEKAPFNDDMLNDFGIHHFHLGTEPHPKDPEFKKRSGPLLFAMVNDHDFYCIGCFEHGDWSEKRLLDIIHENWPDLISSSAINDPSDGNQKPSVLEMKLEFTTADIKYLRKTNVNVLTKRPDGTIHVGPGGGLTCAGASTKVSIKAAVIKSACNQVEREVRSVLANRPDFTKRNGTLTVRLEQHDGDTFAVPDDGSPAINLHSRLRVFPLGDAPCQPNSLSTPLRPESVQT